MAGSSILQDEEARDNNLSEPLIRNDIELPRTNSQNVVLGTSPIRRVVFNMVTSIVGAGLVALPAAIEKAGLVTGVLLTLGVAIVSGYSINMLVETGVSCGVRNYEELMDRYFGVVGYSAVCLMLLTFDIGALLSSLIILGDVTTDLLRAIGERYPHLIAECGYWCMRRWCILIFANILILPLVLHRDISKLEKSSVVAVITVIGMLSVVVAAAVAGDNCPSRPELADAFSLGNGICPDTSKPWLTVFGENPFAAFGIITFTFVSHDSSFLIYATLRNPTKARWVRTIASALSIAVTLSLSMAIAAYLSFRETIKDDLLKNYALDDTKIVVVRILYAVTLTMAFPISFFICRHVMNELAHRWTMKDECRIPGTPSGPAVQHISLTRHLTLTLPLFVFTVGMSMFVDGLGIVMSITGNIAASSIAFVFPPLCAIAHFVEHDDELRVLSFTDLLCSRANCWKILKGNGGRVVLLLFGTVTLVITTICTLVLYKSN